MTGWNRTWRKNVHSFTLLPKITFNWLLFLVNGHSIEASIKFYLFHFNGLLIGFENSATSVNKKQRKIEWVGFEMINVNCWKKISWCIVFVYDVFIGKTHVLCMLSLHFYEVELKIVLALIIIISLRKNFVGSFLSRAGRNFAPCKLTSCNKWKCDDYERCKWIIIYLILIHKTTTIITTITSAKLDDDNWI